MVQFDEVPAVCGGCGHTWDILLKRPLTLNPGDSFSFAVRSVEVTCPECGVARTNDNPLSANGIKDGVRLPVLHLGAVIKDLAARDRDELIGLRSEVERLRERQDAAAADELLQRTGLAALFRSQGNRMEMLALLNLVFLMVGLVLQLRPPELPHPTDADIQKIVVSVTV